MLTKERYDWHVAQTLEGKKLRELDENQRAVWDHLRATYGEDMVWVEGGIIYAAE